MSEQFKPVKIGDVSSDGKFTPVSRDDFNALRPEVRETLDRLRKCVLRCEPELDHDLATIRAELLRLAVRNAELEAKATRDHEWGNDLLTENKKAEAELAALKARIADSPIASLVYGQGDLLAVISAENPDDWAGKRVRLVEVE